MQESQRPQTGEATEAPAETRQPYQPPAIETVEGALPALLASQGCLDPGGDPPDLA